MYDRQTWKAFTRNACPSPLVVSCSPCTLKLALELNRIVRLDVSRCNLVDAAIPESAWNGPLRFLEEFDGSYNRFTDLTGSRLASLPHMSTHTIDPKWDSTPLSVFSMSVAPDVDDGAFGACLVNAMKSYSIDKISSLDVTECGGLLLEGGANSVLEDILDFERGVALRFASPSHFESMFVTVRFTQRILENLVELAVDGRNFTITEDLQTLRSFRLRYGWVRGCLKSLRRCERIDVTGSVLVDDGPWTLFAPSVEELRIGFVRFGVCIVEEAASSNMPLLRVLDVSGLMEEGGVHSYAVLRSFSRRRFVNITELTVRRADSMPLTLLVSILHDTVHACTLDIKESEITGGVLLGVAERALQNGSIADLLI